ncbi:hypothetical protein VNO77_03797 [Canavalia gladiata]|uniref:COBRA C-terminal domain-containing protein n=1 Tax=Canavalia gladiata TaxID=3824 RepID=A0AAN9N112_CANGL
MWVVALFLGFLYLCLTYELYIPDRVYQTLSESASVSKRSSVMAIVTCLFGLHYGQKFHARSATCSSLLVLWASSLVQYTRSQLNMREGRFTDFAFAQKIGLSHLTHSSTFCLELEVDLYNSVVANIKSEAIQSNEIIDEALTVYAYRRKNNLSPLVQCTSHMCPIQVHRHVKLNYKEYWCVKSMTPYGELSSIMIPSTQLALMAMYSQSYRKDKVTFTFDKGWAFPRRIHFNSDNCVMPPLDAYPWLPDSSSRQ